MIGRGGGCDVKGGGVWWWLRMLVASDCGQGGGEYFSYKNNNNNNITVESHKWDLGIFHTKISLNNTKTLLNILMIKIYSDQISA